MKTPASRFEIAPRTIARPAMRGCRLTLVEMLGALGPGMYPALVQDVMERITPHAPQVLTGHKLKCVVPGGVELIRLSDGEVVLIEAEHVVLALGVRPRRAVADRFRAVFKNVYVVGDAQKGGRILEATQDAHGKASSFDPS